MLDDEVKKFAEVIRVVVKEEIQPVSEQVANLTERVEGLIIPTLENQTKYFKKIMSAQEKNEDNTERLDKRLSKTEGRLGIQPSPESHYIK